MKIKVGDIGTVFEMTLTDQDGVVDITAASTLEFNFKEPDDSTWTATATLSSGGADGKMKYAFIADDLDNAGVWHAEAFIVLASGSWTSDCVDFEVFDSCVS